jgi:hypothetical protein
MMHILIALGVASLPGFSARAQDKYGRGGGPYAALFIWPPQFELTKYQLKQLAALSKEYTPKLRAIDDECDKVVSPERRRAAEDAVRAAKASGRKLRELNGVREAALNITPWEEKRLKTLNKLRMGLIIEIQRKRMAVLTEEQKALLGPKDKGSG